MSQAWAEALDKLAPDERRALHGLPVSVKDCIMVKGLDCTLGLLKKVGQPAPVDADVVTVLKEHGAVPFVKTNTSQLCISPGCSNPLWGAALHPLNAARTPGGSSGGEGVLISGGGSVLGIGSDIGGSIRLPASWCGVVGIKPTAKRMSRRGLVSAVRPIGIFGTSGLMGKDGAFVAEATKALFSVADFHAFDPEVPPLPWNDSVYLSKKALRVGWFDSISLFPSTPGVKRAVAQAVAAFEALGHEVVAFPEQNWMECLDIFVQLLFADQGKFTDLLLDGETVDEELSWYKSFAAVPPNQTEDRCPEFQRQFGGVAVQHSFGTLSSCTDLWSKMIERSVFVNTFYQNWKSNGLDLLLCPICPSPAPMTEQVGMLSFSLVLTMMFNVMDYPAAAVPVTRQTQEDELNIANYSCTDKIHDLIKQVGFTWHFI
ncbi:fatty-acid amide hydrolase 1-like [Hyalella azteca]|uniref:Fatty-acid amide hydrolase 1-like n=1 Tax=Hyalella azteca TaxID=294128 RepID=A0A8B7NX35_HYAAZ|nr:fatty-acid amide hydrolase 1-like [Hyalella azteca]